MDIRLRGILRKSSMVVRKSGWEMVAEFLREIGVLVIVFFPIEAVVSGVHFRIRYYALAEAMGFAAWVGGTLLEVKRKS